MKKLQWRYGREMKKFEQRECDTNLNEKPSNGAKIKIILQYACAAFLIMMSLAFLPSLSGVLLLIAGLLCLPVIKKIPFLNNFFSKKKWIRLASILLIFFIAMGVSPTNAANVSKDSAKKEKVTKVVKEESKTKSKQNVKEDKKEQVDSNKTNTATIPSTTEPSKSEKIVVDSQAKGISIKEIPAYSGKPYVAINNNVPFFQAEQLTGAVSSYETYSNLDNLGRCGVCIASIGKDIMPTSDRGTIGSVKPSGWQTIKYNGVVPGNYLYNRCHLIGFQLSGENANEKNLITGTRYLNIEGMLPFENMVADYVKETNKHVLYRVTPLFDGSNLVASGVLMEGRSVEDNGKAIMFNVFCYNVQPGVAINYGTGTSSLDGTVSASTNPTTPPPTNNTTVAPKENVSAPPVTNNTTSQVWIPQSGTKYHSNPSCSGMVNPKQITLKEAEAAGYEPCKRCH